MLCKRLERYLLALSMLNVPLTCFPGPLSMGFTTVDGMNVVLMQQTTI